MAFPSSPTNGQQATVNGITYSYSSATKSWRRVASAGNLTANFGTFSGNVTANNYIISGPGVFWSNSSPAVYNTSFWVQNQDYGFTANTVDYGNILGLVTDSVDTIYDNGSVLGGSAIDGNNIVNSTITGNKFVSNLELTSPISIKAMYETATITSSAPTATTNFDIITQATQFFTSNITSNITLNIRGNSSTSFNSIVSTGQSVTLSLLVTNGATGYIPNIVQVDGSNVTVNWLNGTSPSTAFSNCKVAYTFTAIKTASNVFTVLGSQTRYG